MGDGEAIRISDQQRERAAQEIREHYASGRLNDDELDERIQGAYAARTEADLRTVRSELPRLPASPAQQRQELAQRRRHLQRRVLQESGGALGGFVVCTAIWLAAGAHGAFWPLWVGLVVVIALLRNGWRLYGPAPELDRVEQELGRREHRADRAERTERRAQRRGRRGR